MGKPSLPWRSWILCLALATAAPAARAQERREVPLAGPWQFQRDGAPPDAWKAVVVPSTYQEHEGPEFKGVGHYRTTLPPVELPARARAILHFDAAATDAEVFLGGRRLGGHLGGWTPFRFDVTDLLRAPAPAGGHALRVRLDQKPGHNTQGFLPIIQPHFGGLWQGARIIVVPEIQLDDLRLLASGDPATKRLRLEAPVLAAGRPAAEGVPLDYRVTVCRRGAGDVVAFVGRAAASAGGQLALDLHVPAAVPWSPQSPALYDVRLEVRDAAGRADAVTVAAAFRRIEAHGDHLRLNGNVLVVRGLLNWGCYPPRFAPHPDEKRFAADLAFARARGFNLMKFCLWVPPKRYLEMCDEAGVLAWVEYPTWHPKLDAAHRADLAREFAEFFHFDRNHPGVILRSLTCETGPSADLAVLRELYDLAHATIPGAVVEDDSSWIGWNRIHDFYDDHPYGNNHTWAKALAGFREHILAHGPKPLVLGEAIAADTWFDGGKVIERVGDGPRPFWAPGFLDAMAPWEQRLARAAADPALPARLAGDSRRYAMLMRKYQVETYRREVPYGGYVVSVIRDFPLAAMGLIDYLDQPKWTAQEWAWQADTMLLLRTEEDRRSYFAGDRLRTDVLLSHMAPEKLENAELVVTLHAAAAPDKELARASKVIASQNAGTLARVLALDLPLPAPDAPARFLLTARLRTGAGGPYVNQWPLWVVPRPKDDAFARVRVHRSVPADIARDLFPAAAPFDAADRGSVVVASAFDDALISFIESGGRALVLPTGQPGSFPTANHWFLRGAPAVPDHPLTRRAGRDLLVDLQHFDLASPVVPNVTYLEMIDPVLLLWDNHDIKTVKTHALVFETRAGAGRLLVSALRHAGPTNAAGRHVLATLLDHLATGPAPRNTLSDAAWKRLKEKLHEQKLDLTRLPWRFKPDPRDAGVRENWATIDPTDAAGWKDIRVGAPWDGQGYPGLDGLAWYRLTVKVPERWKGRDVYLITDGADDAYTVHINGHPAGAAGDKATKRTAFDQRSSHRITTLAEPGKEITIAFRVDDWQGAGGLFRPIRLSTADGAEGEELIK